LAMEFCPNCGSILTLAKKSKKAVLVCKKCGYTKQTAELVITVKQNRKEKKSVAMVEEDEESNIHPKTTDVQCPSCGNREAYWWSVQTRSADEPMTQFFRCTKCGYTWREYA